MFKIGDSVTICAPKEYTKVWGPGWQGSRAIITEISSCCENITVLMQTGKYKGSQAHFNSTNIKPADEKDILVFGLSLKLK